MPRGRHRQSPPLHRLLVPASVSAAALVCAGGAWLAGEPGFDDPQTVVLRGLTAAAAVAAIAGAVVLRTWDKEAGKHVSELNAQRTSAEWRAEERQAELEEELEEAREERDKARGRVRDQQATLARLRNEHATLLRRYAHAEAERARALEGRRQLELESGEPAKALTAAATDHRQPSGAPTPLTYLQAGEALAHLARNHSRQREREEEQRRGDEEREREEEQRLAEERGREKARAAAAERQRAAKPASPPGLAPGGFDFFGTGSGGGPGGPRGTGGAGGTGGTRGAGNKRPGKHQRPGYQGELPKQREREPESGARSETGGSFESGLGSDSGHQPLPAAEPQPEAASGTGVEPGTGGAGPDGSELRNVS
jgi:hypothetical protein